MKRTAGCMVALLMAALAVQQRVYSRSAADAPQPEMIGEGVISTPDDELGGTITADGKTLYFEKSAPPHYLYILYESHLVGGKWAKPSVLPFSGRYKDTDPVLSPDEQNNALRVRPARWRSRSSSLLYMDGKEDTVRME